LISSLRDVFSFIDEASRNHLCLDASEADFAVRKFVKRSPAEVDRFELIGKTFIEGYNLALLGKAPIATIINSSNATPSHLGFYSEGVAMGAAIADALPSLNSKNLDKWIAQERAQYDYLNHIGAGWALAKVPWRKKKILDVLNPTWKWLAFDGLGFHDTYFYHEKITKGWKRKRLKGYEGRAYDQGVGRALWFVACGDLAIAKELIDHLDCNSDRGQDLWSGLGLAITYAGGELPNSPENIIDSRYLPSLAQGCAFALEARSKQGFFPKNCKEVAKLLIPSISINDCVALVKESLSEVRNRNVDEQYEFWRVRVRDKLSKNLCGGRI